MIGSNSLAGKIIKKKIKNAVEKKIETFFIDLVKNKLPKKSQIILSVVIVIIFLIIIISILVPLYTKDKCPNPSSKMADNGQCCPYGATQYNKQCYLTDCTGIENKNGVAGVRNKNGICCTNGITHETINGVPIDLNCLSEKNCPASKQLNNICCTYGITNFKINCYLSYCDSKSRTLYGKCCKNGLAKNDLSCNKTCEDGENTFSGGCCEYGVAEDTKYCKTKECAYYTKKGKCCSKNVTANGSNCNITCNHDENIFTTISHKQICCPYGINEDVKNDAKDASTICYSNSCKGIDAQRTANGACCTNGVTVGQKHCVLKCAINSVNTISGACCPDSYGLTKDNKKCYSTPCNVKEDHVRSISGLCCTGKYLAVNGACIDPCPRGGSNTIYSGKCCPHGIAPGISNSFKICNQTCTTQRGGSGLSNIKSKAQGNSNLQDDKASHASALSAKAAAKQPTKGPNGGANAPNVRSGSATITNIQHDILGNCCISGLTTKSWNYCNSVCRSVTKTMSDYSTLKEDKSQLESRIHNMGGIASVIGDLRQDYENFIKKVGSDLPIYNKYIKPYIKEFEDDFIKPLEQQIEHAEENFEHILPYGGKFFEIMTKFEHILNPMNPLFAGAGGGRGSKKGDKKNGNSGKLKNGSGGSGKLKNGSGIQQTHAHKDLNKQHLSTGICCTYGKTYSEKACFTTNCSKPKERLINNSKVCCNATVNKKNCKTETIKTLISDIQRSGVLLGAVAYKCANAGVCGYDKLKCAPNCDKQVSYFCACCTGNNTCLTDIFGICGTMDFGVCWPK